MYDEVSHFFLALTKMKILSGRDPPGKDRRRPAAGVPQVRAPRQLRHQLLQAQRRGHQQQRGQQRPEEVRGPQVGLRADRGVREKKRDFLKRETFFCL